MHALASDLAAGVTLTYYPLDDAMQVSDPALAGRHVDDIVAAAGDELVLFQEVGYPAGDEPVSDPGSSEELQRRFVAAFFEALPSRPRIRFASYFSLEGFSEETVDRLLGYCDLHLEPFREFLATLGVHRTDGTERPAFEALPAGIRSVRVPH